MTNDQVRASILKTVDAYKAKLSTYPEEIFERTPPIGGWSYSEVYTHIFDSSILSLDALENCIKGKVEDHSTIFAAKLILFFGGFPPIIRYKVPKRLAERVKKITKTEAQDFISSFEKGLENTYPGVDNARKDNKTKHPRLGYLNAKQWLRFIEIHLKHHLKQLNRIEKSFNS